MEATEEAATSHRAAVLEAIQQKALAESELEQLRLRTEELEGVLDSEHTCVICTVSGRQILTEPCKHVCMCRTCAEQVDDCPVCRMHIRSKVFVYL